MATPNHRQENQRVYILHTYPFKETSLIAEVFTEKFGRIPVVAKGAQTTKIIYSWHASILSSVACELVRQI